jgi:acyl-homoserine lactone synthase
MPRTRRDRPRRLQAAPPPVIEVVTSRNALLYQDALGDMFHLRHSTPKDRFDTDAAIYLLLTEDNGTVIGAQRALPTLGPHLFSEELAQLCDVKGVQRGAKILELTQGCIDEETLDLGATEWARKRLTVGLFEFGLRAGFEKFTLLIPTDELFRYVLFGLDVKPLGLPVACDGGHQVAVVVRVDRAALDAMRTALGVPEQQVDYVGAPQGDPLVLAPLDTTH